MVVTPEQIAAATPNQLRSWLFALAWTLKRTHFDKLGGIGKYAPLYKIAKNLVGPRSLIFGLDKYGKTVRGERDDASRLLGQLLLASVEIREQRIRMMSRYLIRDMSAEFIHENVVELEYREAIADVRAMRGPYSATAVELAKAAFEEECSDLLGVLADALEDCDRPLEALHFRSGKHCPSCPLIQKIMPKRK